MSYILGSEGINEGLVKWTQCWERDGSIPNRQGENEAQLHPQFWSYLVITLICYLFGKSPVYTNV